MKKTFFITILISILITSCQNKEEIFKENFKKGLIALDASNLELSLTHFNKCVELKPNHPESYYYLGAIMFNKKDYLGAIQYYSKAIDLNPNYTEAYYNRGLSYNVLNRMDEKCEDFFKAYELGKTNLEIRLKECR